MEKIVGRPVCTMPRFQPTSSIGSQSRRCTIPVEALRTGHGTDIMDERDKINKTNIELGREKRADFKRQFTRLWHRHGDGPLVGASEGL